MAECPHGFTPAALRKPLQSDTHLSRVAAVAGDLQAFQSEAFHVGFFYVLESDEAISKAPVSSVPLARTNVVEYNYSSSPILPPGLSALFMTALILSMTYSRSIFSHFMGLTLNLLVSFLYLASISSTSSPQHSLGIPSLVSLSLSSAVKVPFFLGTMSGPSRHSLGHHQHISLSKGSLAMISMLLTLPNFHSTPLTLLTHGWLKSVAS